MFKKIYNSDDTNQKVKSIFGLRLANFMLKKNKINKTTKATEKMIGFDKGYLVNITF